MTIGDALPLALEFLGLWKPGMKCKIYQSSREPRTHLCGKCGALLIVHGNDDIPCPPLTDALAMAMLRALADMGYLPALGAAPRGWFCDLAGQFFSEELYPADPAEAIVLAVAALVGASNQALG